MPKEDCIVKNIEVIERHVQPQGDSKVVMNIRYINDEGKETSDIFSCEGKIKKRSRIPPPPMKPPKPTTLKPLPMRQKFEFDSDDDAISFLKDAIKHLLKDKGYIEKENKEKESDLYFQKGEGEDAEAIGFFINLAPRFDEECLNRAKKLIKLRMKYGSENDYGLVLPAFQDSLGVSLLKQDNWLRRNGEYLATHRIGVYAVNNKNPNQIFPFTVYPNPGKSGDLARYFMYTVQQWQVMRNKYVESR